MIRSTGTAWVETKEWQPNEHVEGVAHRVLRADVVSRGTTMLKKQLGGALEDGDRRHHRRHLLEEHQAQRRCLLGELYAQALHGMAGAARRQRQPGAFRIHQRSERRLQVEVRNAHLQERDDCRQRLMGDEDRVAVVEIQEERYRGVEERPRARAQPQRPQPHPVPVPPAAPFPERGAGKPGQQPHEAVGAEVEDQAKANRVQAVVVEVDGAAPALRDSVDVQSSVPAVRDVGAGSRGHPLTAFHKTYLPLQKNYACPDWV